MNVIGRIETLIPGLFTRAMSNLMVIDRASCGVSRGATN